MPVAAVFTEYLTAKLLASALGVPMVAFAVNAPVEGFIDTRTGNDSVAWIPAIV